MNAGRELDALVASKVMRLKGEGDFNPPAWVIPEYSTDIAAAWTIIEHFYQAGWGAGASMDGHTGCEASVGQFTARADTPMEAICLAALKAVGAA